MPWLRTAVLGMWENSGEASAGVSAAKNLTVYLGVSTNRNQYGIMNY